MLDVEKIITISVMALWILFPFGMFISIYRQEQEEKRNLSPQKKKERPDIIHVVPHATYTYDDEDEEDMEQYEYTRVPKKDPYDHTYGRKNL